MENRAQNFLYFRAQNFLCFRIKQQSAAPLLRCPSRAGTSITRLADLIGTIGGMGNTTQVMLGGKRLFVTL